MDHMLELATRFFRNQEAFNRYEGRFDEYLRELDLDQSKEQGESRISGDRDDHIPPHTVWVWRDERARQLLAEIFYRHPEVAAEIAAQCQIWPSFIVYVDQRIGYVLNDSPWWHPRLFTEVRKSQSELETLMTSAELTWRVGENDSLRARLIGNPELLRRISQIVNCAVPFSMTLSEELNEVDRSRQTRLAPDRDARAAVLMQRISERENELRLRAGELEDKGETRA